MNIEMSGVATVEKLLAKSDHITANINQNDKEPSWDGYVEVYRSASNTHPKSDLYEKVSVQVKGHLSELPFPNTIHFSVDVSDLQNYLYEGGTIFFVVYVDSEGENDKTYYAELLPYNLKKLLRSCKNGQITKSIELKPFPQKKKDISNTFLNFAKNKQQQRASISMDDVTLKTLVDEKMLTGLSLGYIDVSDDNSKPFNYLFKHDSYLYAKLPYNQETPVAHLDCVSSIEQTVKDSISINGEKYYSGFKLQYKEDSESFQIGKGVTITNRYSSSEGTVSYTPKGKLSERIADLSFMIALMENQSLEIGNRENAIENIAQQDMDGFNIERKKDELKFLIDAEDVLSKLDVVEDLDLDSASLEDMKLLALLISGIKDKKPIPLNLKDSTSGKLKICNLTILVVAIKDDATGRFNVYNYFDAPVTLKGADSKGKKYDLSRYIYLKCDDLDEASNINCNEIFREITHINLSSIYQDQVIRFGLELILAYDKNNTKNEQFLSLAHDIYNWLESKATTEKTIIKLNLLQIAKRKRKLCDDEIAFLCRQVENQSVAEDIRVAAYLLMENYQAAKLHFDCLPQERQNEFVGFPIYHFWNKEALSNGQT